MSANWYTKGDLRTTFTPITLVNSFPMNISWWTCLIHFDLQKNADPFTSCLPSWPIEHAKLVPRGSIRPHASSLRIWRCSLGQFATESAMKWKSMGWLKTYLGHPQKLVAMKTEGLTTSQGIKECWQTMPHELQQMNARSNEGLFRAMYRLKPI